MLDDAKAEDTVVIDLMGKTSLADSMIVTSGRSNRHVGSIADRVIEALKESGLKDVKVEGMPHCDWVLIDAGDVIVHVFRPEVRHFYNLEKMWGGDRPANARLPEPRGNPVCASWSWRSAASRTARSGNSYRVISIARRPLAERWA